MDAIDDSKIRQLFDDYVQMYSSRDDRLTTYFSENFSGFTGGGDFLVKDQEEWVAITRQDFDQIKEPIRIEIKDLATQSLADTIAVATGFFNIHLPTEDRILSNETARLVLIFRLESPGWKISHSSISIPYHLVGEGEVYPMKELVDRNQFLEKLVSERTIQLSDANENLKKTNEKLAFEIAEHKQAEENLNKTTYDLGERLKELNCLYRISGLFENENITEKILQGIADIIPPSWQYPDITCAQIKLGDQSYSSDNFKESKWGQSQQIIASGIIVGEVKVFYSEEKTEIHNDPFFKEERDLINVIAERIGHFFERNKAEFEKVKLESRLQQAQKMEAIGTLAGGIAHDFNNILGAIIGYTEMARDDSPKESSVVEDLDKVLEASNRAAGLVKQILAFSRQDETEYILLQPSSIVEKAITMIRPSLPTTIEIIQDIDTKTGNIFGDPTQIHQILINLCTNAFHAMEDTGGRLDISLKEIDLRREDITPETYIDAGTFIQLSIGDSGAGMTQQVKDKIFDPYFTTKEVGKGTGMGLSIVHGIIKNYGGFLTLSSEPGKGTVFHVFLPVVNKEVLPTIEAIKQIPVGKEKILFIDDEDVLADMGKTMLERLGYHVTVRKSSLEALETFQNQPDQFDVVITDQTMPGMTGVDLARRMLQIRPDIPIILCTGYSSIISEEKAKSIGVREFALKPVGKGDLAVLIRKVLNGNHEK